MFHNFRREKYCTISKLIFKGKATKRKQVTDEGPVSRKGAGARGGGGTRAEQLCFPSGCYPSTAGAQSGNTGLMSVSVT